MKKKLEKTGEVTPEVSEQIARESEGIRLLISGGHWQSSRIQNCKKNIL